MQYAVNASFHRYMDVAVLPNLTTGPSARPGGPVIIPQRAIIRERTLSYRFSPHFHPWAGELVHRLLEKAIPGLESIDTEYQANSDGTRAALPDSTRVTLAAGTPVRMPDGTALTLPGPLPVTVPDGTQAALPDGTRVTLPGSILWTGTRGLKAIRTDGTIALLAEGAQLTVPSGTAAVRSDGSAVTLTADGQATLDGAMPMPVLYDGIFSSTRYAPSDIVRRP